MAIARRRSKGAADPRPVDGGIGYALGLEASHRGELAALETLNTALETFLVQEDVKGAALASAALLMTNQIIGSFRRFPEHIERLGVVRGDFAWRDRDEELLALTGLLAGLIFFGPDDPFLEACVERTMTLLGLDLDVNVRFAAGRLVLFYSEPREMRALAQRVYSLLRPSVERPDLTPHRLGHWLTYWSRCARYANDPKQSELAEQQARRLAETHQLRDILGWLAYIDFCRSLPERNLAGAERALAAAESVMDAAYLGAHPRMEYLRTKLAVMKGQADRAVFHASRATKFAAELELPPSMRAVYIVSEAQARLFSDDFAPALELLRHATELVPGHYVQEIRDMIALTAAYQAMAEGRSDGRELLANAWSSIRERQFYDTFDGFPEFGAKLCVLALEHGIESDFVRRLIESQNIAPPANAPESWPWAIRVHALGGFTVQRRGEPLTFEGKTQKKPMELLKVLIALGGRGVAKQKLYDLLWPDSDAAAAAAALDVVISRLRKLLGEPDAVLIEEGKVGLDPERVWLDVWAFDRDVEALQSVLQGRAEATVVDSLGQRLLARYGGPFLGSEDPQRWSLAARDRWQNRFRRSLADAGHYWEQGGDWARAIALYERALEEDSLAENLYRRLMRGHLARGEPAEAARVYRRCREMLSVQLGIPPSADTEALFKSIYKT
jgi:LuxR family transcriptional regulator, maltose regulon positive regulatory protein